MDDKLTPQPETPKEAEAPEVKKPAASLPIFNWSTLLVGLLTTFASILGTPYGIWVAGGMGILGTIAAFFARSALKDWRYESAKRQAGAKAGEEASQGQQRLDQAHNEIDEFLGRDSRS